MSKKIVRLPSGENRTYGRSVPTRELLDSRVTSAHRETQMDIAVVECLDLPHGVEFIEDRHAGARTFYIRPGSWFALAGVLPAFDRP